MSQEDWDTYIGAPYGERDLSVTKFPKLDGDTVYAHLPARALHLFDATTGRRV